MHSGAVASTVRSAVLSLIPTMTQLYTPSPSTARLAGVLCSRGSIRIEADIADVFDEMRRQPRHDWPKLAKRGEGLKGVLQAVGLQLEKTLAAVFQ